MALNRSKEETTYNSLNIKKNLFYDVEKKMTQSSRIDLAYEIFQLAEILLKDKETVNAHPELPQLKENMMKFLDSAFDLNPTLDTDKKIARVHLLMSHKLKKKVNPEYIPGKSPAPPLVEFLRPEMGETKAEYNWGRIIEALSAVRSGKKMTVNAEDQIEDKKDNIKMLTPEERDQYRVEIIKHVFQKRDAKDSTYHIFDTSQMIAHGKKGYAAFVIDRNGAIYLFNHKKTEDKIAHSSLNAGGNTFGAGEMEIVQGELKVINTYSGHYEPNIYNVFEILTFLVDKGVNIENVRVHVFENLNLSFEGKPINQDIDEALSETTLKYSYSALDIYNHPDEMKEFARSNWTSLQDFLGTPVSLPIDENVISTYELEADGDQETELKVASTQDAEITDNTPVMSDNPLFQKQADPSEAKLMEQSGKRLERLKNIFGLFSPHEPESQRSPQDQQANVTKKHSS